VGEVEVDEDWGERERVRENVRESARGKPMSTRRKDGAGGGRGVRLGGLDTPMCRGTKPLTGGSFKHALFVDAKDDNCW
jgi:hypothetical protein